MFQYLMLVTLFGACICEEPVPIVHQESVVEPDGKFHFSFESGDGTKVEEHGELKTVGSEVAEAVEGDFSYNAPDGQPIKVHYVADENGYQPQGEHIPKVPEAIARAIKWIEDHPQVESARGRTSV